MNEMSISVVANARMGFFFNQVYPKEKHLILKVSLFVFKAILVLNNSKPGLSTRKTI